MKLRSMETADLAGKIILYRSPYDIERVEKEGGLVLKNLSRIEATLPTLRYLLEQKCRIVILTYVGRPNGKVVEELRTTPHAEALSKLLNHSVEKVDDSVGDKVREAISKLIPGSVLMLENTRFHPGEMEDDDDYAKELARNGEIVVFDAFPQAHRTHASVTGIMRHLPSFAGYYCIQEVEALSGLLKEPQPPFTMIVGGAKVSDKIGAIDNLWEKVNSFLLGGGVANVFLKSCGKEMGDSFLEDIYIGASEGEKKDWVDVARKLLTRDSRSQKLVLPKDLVIGKGLNNPTDVMTVQVGSDPDLVPLGFSSLDIGPKTQEYYSRIIKQAGTVFWNGPLGIAEDERFSVGSISVATAMAESSAATIVAGGDTVDIVNDLGMMDKFTHLSLAGGATLEFLAGKTLPALEMLREA